jgi:catechol 2,3-dioxygenase-like lactoylglutathione lyase family enzyme
LPETRPKLDINHSPVLGGRAGHWGPSRIPLVEQRISMVMIGTRDIAALRRFYEDGLGWQPWVPASGRSVQYSVGFGVLVFLDAGYLAKESGAAAAPNAVAMAQFVDSKQEVDDIFRRALAAGATEQSAIRDRDGGIYSGYFADVEGNAWEIAWSPSVPVDAYTKPAPATES